MSRYASRPDEGEPSTYAYGPIDDLQLKATVAQVLDRRPCAGLSVAVIADGGVVPRPWARRCPGEDAYH
jgi:hypothetical protein